MVAPSNRITLGAVGIGPRGRYVLSCMLNEPDVRFVAICDVQASRRKAVKDMADAKYGNRDCVMVRDMFELLDRPDIDALLIATGDHWHAMASILAASFQELKGNKQVCETTIGLFQTLLLADPGDMDHIIEAVRRRFRPGQRGGPPQGPRSSSPRRRRTCPGARR